MRYFIDATAEGYRFGTMRHAFEEIGGHGPQERLYAQAEHLFNTLRAGEAPEHGSYIWLGLEENNEISAPFDNPGEARRHRPDEAGARLVRLSRDGTIIEQLES